VTQSDSLNDIAGGISIPWCIIVTVPAVLLAVYGYGWVHRIQPYLTVLFGGVLIAAVILTATSEHSLAKGMGGTHLSSFPIFIAAVRLFFMSMLSWAVYVSDYSRYLPKNVSGPKTFWAVFSGNALGTILYAGLGIWVVAMVPTGSFAAASLASITVALGAQIPFLDQTLYVGPAVSALHGADISWLVGFVVAGAGYLLASRLVGGWSPGGTPAATESATESA
jgi:purine-cytosine permease-like protein